MKNILVAINFSDYAQQVALYTAELCQLTNARLILFYAYNPKLHTPETEVLIDEPYVQHHLDKLARNIHQKTKASVTRLVTPGALQQVTFEVAGMVKADLIIICQNRTDPSVTMQPVTPFTGQTNLQLIPTLVMAEANNPEPETIRPILADFLNLSGFGNSPLLEVS
ncbi:universal stress protein [Pontibacter sp. MBLB2868]|uniref:universal stress protein n=1 Tax=Pontibacter sp. MBLB2868 TaxID=3451555 RepID=UPI003F7541B7